MSAPGTPCARQDDDDVAPAGIHLAVFLRPAIGGLAAIAPEFVVEARFRALAGVDLYGVVAEFGHSFGADGQGVAREQHRGGNDLKRMVHGGLVGSAGTV